MSLEELRDAADLEARSNQEMLDDKESADNAFAWVEAHPEYVRCPENEKEFLDYFNSRGMTRLTFDSFEEAFKSKCASGLMKIDEKVLAEREKQKHQTRGKELKEKRALPSEEELEQMPLNEIYKRASDPEYASAQTESEL